MHMPIAIAPVQTHTQTAHLTSQTIIQACTAMPLTLPTNTIIHISTAIATCISKYISPTLFRPFKSFTLLKEHHIFKCIVIIILLRKSKSRKSDQTGGNVDVFRAPIINNHIQQQHQLTNLINSRSRSYCEQSHKYIPILLF